MIFIKEGVRFAVITMMLFLFSIVAGCGMGLKHYHYDGTEEDTVSQEFDIGAEVMEDSFDDSAADVDVTDGDAVDAFSDGEDSVDAFVDQDRDEVVCECWRDFECDDGLYCNGEEYCDGCFCRDGMAVRCDDGIACTVDSCSEESRDCQFVPDHDRCDEGEVCDLEEGCIPARECEEDDECQDDSYCNGHEVCNGEIGRCEAGEPIVCDDGFTCTDDYCEEDIEDCAVVRVDSLCDDGRRCTEDVCNPELSPDESGCVHFELICLPDGLWCTDDSCQEEGPEQCSYPVLDGTCLIGGVCYNAGHRPEENPCLVCAPAISQTEWSFVEHGERCDDGQEDTVLDYCDGRGNCIGCQRSTFVVSGMMERRIATCEDSWDNDGNGVADYPDDPTCYGSGLSEGSGVYLVTQCLNHIDDDGDFLIDFGADPGCTLPIDDDEDVITHPQCNDGIDNDGDGLVDFPDDFGCGSYDENDEDPLTVPIETPMCRDGEDNDNDGLVDYPDDPGCLSSDDNDEFDCALQPMCADGIDNDGDGLIDFPDDPGCFSLRDDDELNSTEVATECNDGYDNDGDGAVDFSGGDSECVSPFDNSESI